MTALPSSPIGRRQSCGPTIGEALTSRLHRYIWCRHLALRSTLALARPPRHPSVPVPHCVHAFCVPRWSTQLPACQPHPCTQAPDGTAVDSRDMGTSHTVHRSLVARRIVVHAVLGRRERCSSTHRAGRFCCFGHPGLSAPPAQNPYDHEDDQAEAKNPSYDPAGDRCDFALRMPVESQLYDFRLTDHSRTLVYWMDWVTVINEDDAGNVARTATRFSSAFA
ncbi:hypothetical protein R3P38DRAFT_3192939 [Favolaschia claudopus]|uniref:Uncharacterized protein n=1 Tax=Favolaschia claudopus TaxID=2862362 RepID=A0AAW0BJ55_9AGAR